MTNYTLFTDEFIISDLMCFDSCAKICYNIIKENTFFSELMKQKHLPSDTYWVIAPCPIAAGAFRFTISLHSKTDSRLSEDHCLKLQENIREDIDDVYTIVQRSDIDTHAKTKQMATNKRIWFGVFLIGLLVTINCIFPPSLLLSLACGLITTIGCVISGWDYYSLCLKQAKQGRFELMPSFVSGGALLSVAAVIYHIITMPLAGLSMAIMSFIMPIAELSILHIVDSARNKLLHTTDDLQIDGLSRLLPELKEYYTCVEAGAELKPHIARTLLSQKAPDAKLLQALSFSLTKSSDELSQTNANCIQAGMLIKVAKGACFPVDGWIIHGKTCVDTSIINGEYAKFVGCGEYVPAGAINLQDNVTMLAKCDYYSNTINQTLFRANRSLNPPSPELDTSFNIKVGILFFAGIISVIAAPMLFGIFSIGLMFSNLAGVCFALCPCTIALAKVAPKLFTKASLSQKDIYLHENDGLKQLEKINTIIFDKTGTLTSGNSEVSTCSIKNQNLLDLIHALEISVGQSHPIGRAIIQYTKKYSRTKTINRQMVFDKNNRGVIDQKHALILGNRQLLKEHDIFMTPSVVQEEKKLSSDLTRVFVAYQGKLIGLFGIKHQLRPGVKSVLKKLKKSGKRLMLLTGDSRRAAKQLNAQLDSVFDENNIISEATHQEKEKQLNVLHQPQQHLRQVCVVGDGMNDAEMLKFTTEHGGVACAIDKNSRAAFFANVILNGRLNYLLSAKKLSKKIELLVAQNKALLLSGLYASIFFTVIFASTGMMLPPLLPLLLMSITTFNITGNSFRATAMTKQALERTPNLATQFIASNMCYYTLVAGSACLITGIALQAVAQSTSLLLQITLATTIATSMSLACIATGGALVGITLLAILIYGLVEYHKKSTQSSEQQPACTVSASATNKNITPKHQRCSSLKLQREIITPIKDARRLRKTKSLDLTPPLDAKTVLPARYRTRKLSG